MMGVRRNRRDASSRFNDRMTSRSCGSGAGFLFWRVVVGVEELARLDMIVEVRPLNTTISRLLLSCTVLAGICFYFATIPGDTKEAAFPSPIEFAIFILVIALGVCSVGLIIFELIRFIRCRRKSSLNEK
jgi:hypothetical protein